MKEINYHKITNLNKDERPRERLLTHGPSVLSITELLAILLRSGNGSESAIDLARKIVHDAQDDLDKLSRLTVEQLMHDYKGVGLAKAASIIAAFELSRRRFQNKASEDVRIYDSNTVYNYISPNLLDLEHEEFWVLYLNKALKVIDKRCLSSGGLDMTVVDVRLLYRMAIQLHSTSIIVAHNHPSGQLFPSGNDRDITMKIKNAGEVMDITLQDHLIIGGRGYYSFLDEGIL